MKTVCLYHADCPDGFTAAWAVTKVDPNTELIPVRHGEPPPDCTGKWVRIVDFSYSLAWLLKIASQADWVDVYDHHEGARATLEEFAGLYTNGSAVFDNERSGAGIVWDELVRLPRPALVNYVEDLDLWLFALPNSTDVNAAIAARPYDLAAWEELNETPVSSLVEEGAKLNKVRNQRIGAAVKHYRLVKIDGLRIPVVNCPRGIGSDVAGELAVGRPYACYYWDASDHTEYGLRSTQDGPDVSIIAQAFGGNGHVHAAGFRTPLGEWPWNS